LLVRTDFKNGKRKKKIIVAGRGIWCTHTHTHRCGGGVFQVKRGSVKPRAE